MMRELGPPASEEGGVVLDPRRRSVCTLWLATATVIAATVVLLGPSSARMPSSEATLLRVRTPYEAASVGGPVRNFQAAPEKQVALPVPEILITSNLPLSAYDDMTRQLLADCVVGGPGVEEPVVAGEPSHLIVTLPKDLGTNATSRRLSAEARRAWEAAEFAYVTFENDEGIFGAWGTRINDSANNSFRIDFIPRQPGTFMLTVDLLNNGATWPIHHRRNSTIKILSSDDANTDQGQVTRCNGLPDADAVWFKCATAPGLPERHECLRWGYSFRPGRGSCFYENWTTRDLLAFARNTSQPKRWILIAGTSRIRGIFLSAADHLLDGRRGEFEAAMAKCWGRMDVEIGNIRLTFQDFRAPGILKWPLDGSKRFQCHNASRVTFDDRDYAHNSTLFFRKIFDPTQQPDGLIPTDIVFEYNEWQSPTMYRDILFSSLPFDWDGTATAVFFRSPVTGSMDSPALDRLRRQEWGAAATTATTMDTGDSMPVDIIDTLEIIQPWLRASEFGIHRTSQHWHSCTPAGNVTVSKDIYTTGPIPFAVQGLVTDQLAQMVFNKILGPRPPRALPMATTAALVTTAQDPARPGLKVCTECPLALMPFNIKPKADLACYDSIPRGAFKPHYTPVLPACPAWCMQQPPASFTNTKSGPV